MEEEKICGIYKITSPSGKIYIGESLHIERRWEDYKYSKAKGQPRLRNSFSKYGVNNHTFEIIEKCEFDDLLCRERYWQDEFDVIGKDGLNCVLQKCGDKKRVVDDETMVKIRDSLKGRVFSEEHKSKISEALKGENNGMFGKTGELNPAFGKGLTGELNPWYGKKHSDESKQKMSAAKKGKQSPRKGIKLSEHTINLMISNKVKPVLQYDLDNNFIKEWESIASVVRELKIHNISKVCKGVAKTAGGFIWKYK